MELADILRTLWARRVWVAVGVVVAIAAALNVSYRLEWSGGPKLTSKTIEFGSASTQVLVDAGASPLVDLEADVGPLAARAELYARLVESTPVREAIARQAGIPVQDIVVSGQAGSSSTRAAREPSAEQRANELRGDANVNRVLVVAEGGLPVVSVYAQARTPSLATKLADAGAEGLVSYVTQLERRQAVRADSTVEFRILGPAEGGVVNDGASKSVAGLAFVAVLGLWCLLVILLTGVIDELRRPRTGAAASPTSAPDSDERLDEPISVVDYEDRLERVR